MGDAAANQDRIEVYSHVSARTTQIASVATLALLPIVAYRRRGQGIGHAIDASAKFSVFTAALGAAAGVPMTVYRLSDQNQDQVSDRAYRLRANEKVRRLNEMGLAGFVAGTAVGGLRFLIGSRTAYLVPFGYGVWGCAVATIATVAFPGFSINEFISKH